MKLANSLTDEATIVEALRAFDSGSLASNASRLFDVLGYRSGKTLQLEPNTTAGLLELANRAAFLNPAKAHADKWLTIDFLFQLTDEEIGNLAQGGLDFDSKADVQSDKLTESYILFAVELKGDFYQRAVLADITREIDRLFPMPAVVLLKHGKTLTLSIIDRRTNKRDAARDLLEKVTLTKDIRIEEPHPGQVETLFDLAFPQLTAKYEITNFVQLEEAWRKTLDTSALNKRFYNDLANWHFWALQHVEFQKQEGVTDEVNRATNVIRLITRLIFVWFLKERQLVPETLFDRNELSHLLKDLSDDKSTFYKAILQNLFFATLNSPMNDKQAPRVFREDTSGKRVNEQYMVHNHYRHEQLFKDPVNALRIFAGIPFLSGGLFECLDKCEEVNGKLVETRIDGFSDSSKKQPTIPNKLFFGDEEQIDLNEVYGTHNKRYAVRGLVDTLNRYKFTIAENTPIEEEVALDPELLAKVFENLLASYNPETDATARKQTGSFYTPREIVNYMVDESLIASLETQLAEDGVPIRDLNLKLRQLFSYTDKPHQFSEDEVDKLIVTIDNIKILDPACGSGAFPMGILQKLVVVLAKLDPNNAKWEQRQIERVRQAMSAAEKIEDHKFRENALNDLQAQIAGIGKAFARNEPDYGRKLFLIQNCIYGVDIQPIAIQIAKLRFFVSLIIDQNIDTGTDNSGIRPLPNLETKFVAADVLLDVERPAQGMRQNRELRLTIEQKERELESVRERHFTARTTKTKEKFQKEDKRLRAEIGKLLERDHWPPETITKLNAWNPFDQNSSAKFFDAEWMFGLRRGFDIIIGNPPYVDSETMVRSNPAQRLAIQSSYDTARGNWDLYIPFWEFSIKQTNSRGISTLITPNKWLSIGYGQALRQFARKFIQSFADYSNFRAFEATGVFPVVLIMNKLRKRPVAITTYNANNDIVHEAEIGYDVLEKFDNWGLLLSSNLDLILKLIKRGEKLSTVCEPESAFTVSEAYELADYVRERTRNQENFLKFMNTGTVEPYVSLWGVSPTTYLKTRYHEPVIDKTSFENEFPRRYLQAASPKIILSGMRHFEAFLDDAGDYVAGKSTVLLRNIDSGVEAKFLLALLNSKLVSFFLKECFGRLAMDGGISFTTTNVSEIPIIIPKPEARGSILKLVEQILTAKRNDVNADTSKAETEIDQLVYALYQLDAQEQAIVEAAVQR